MTNPTKFARIVSAAQALLQAAPAVSPCVYRNRVRAIGDNTTAIVVRPARAEREGAVGVGTPSIWLTGLAIECYARGKQSAPADDAADEVLGAMVERLMSDQSLGGLVGGLDARSVDWDFDVDGQQTACVTVTFYVQHHTGAANFS